jgi:short-subunit dehydrogenase
MSRLLSSRYRTAFVTGASSGLGRCFAEMLLGEGVRVWGTARDPSRLAGLGPGNFTAVALDLADRAGAQAAWSRAAAEAGGAFDLVVANAGYGVFGEFAATGWAVWQAQLEAMLGTHLAVVHAAYGAMRAQGRGCLVNVSSLAAEFPLPFMSGYNVAKAGLSALSESLLFESRGTEVRIVDFRPGDYRTAFNQAMQIPTTSASTARAWGVLDAMLRSAPPPARAAADLRRALRRGRRGIVRSGSFFQARVAPLAARVLPAAAMRAASARYFGC